MKARRSDGNQATLVEQMRKIGLSVFVTSRVGQGFPDVVAGKAGQNFLFEIKDPSQPPSKRVLTTDEQDFFDSWKGKVHKVETIDDVIKIVNS